MASKKTLRAPPAKATKKTPKAPRVSRAGAERLAPELARHEGSWMITLPDGSVTETFSRRVADSAAKSGSTVETAGTYLGRINKAIREQDNGRGAQRAKPAARKPPVVQALGDFLGSLQYLGQCPECHRQYMSTSVRVVERGHELLHLDCAKKIGLVPKGVF